MPPSGISPFINIYVSNCSDWRYSALLAVHELVEAIICYKDGITSEQVDQFDLQYNKTDYEPGDDIAAPYYKQHQIAMGFERMLAAELGVDWNKYETELSLMTENYPKDKK
jgi:hypothetical protein